MAASINDKLRKYKSLFSTTLSTGIGTGTSDTITPATVTGLPTDTAITLTIDRVDSSGTATPSKLERIKGIISGGNLIDYVRGVDGTTEQAHSAGAVVEMVWNAADLNDIVDWGLVEHSQLGVHDKTKVVDLTTAQTLTNKTLTSPKINENVALTATATELNNLHSKTVGLGAWTSYSPTLTNITIGNGTKGGFYTQIGKTVFYGVDIVFGSTTSVSGSIGISLPVIASSNNMYSSYPCTIFDSGGNPAWINGILRKDTETLISLLVIKTDGTYAGLTDTSSTVPITWTTNDQIHFMITYEAA